jgi:hypothetical protein
VKAGERFEQPGGAILGERRGGMERGEGAIYRCGWGIELGRHLIELKRRNQCRGSVTGVDFGPGKKKI